MRKLALILIVLCIVLIPVQSGPVKRDNRWACQWDCSSYNTYARQQQQGLDSMQDFYGMLGISRKKRVVYSSSYRNDCDCDTFYW